MARPDGDLGARVRAARSYANLSQAALGEQLGLTRQIVNAIEADDDRHPLTLREAQQIAQICGVPLSFLLDGWDSASPETLERVSRRLDAIDDRLDRAEQERDALVRSIGQLRSRAQEHLGLIVETELAQAQTPGDEAERKPGAGQRAREGSPQPRPQRPRGHDNRS